MTDRKPSAGMAVVLLSLVASASCSGGSPTTPPPPPTPRASIAVTLSDLSAVRTTTGHRYGVRVTAKESAGVAATLTALSLTFFTGDTRIGSTSWDAEFGGALAANGSKTLLTATTDSGIVGANATRVTAALTYSDVVGAGTSAANVDLPRILAPPVVNSFSLSDNSIVPGAETTLRWDVSNVATVTISPTVGVASAVGQMTLRPSGSTTFQLSATNADGNASRSTFLYVGPAGTCSASFYPARATAICNNGTVSESTSRSGTCSGNGGVRCWICPGPLCTG